MDNKNKVKKWIDLSGLSRLQNGTIDWKKSVGIVLPFMYDNILGQLTILKYVGKSKCIVRIVTDNLLMECQMTSYNIRFCQFGNAFQKPISATHPDMVKYFVNKNDAFKYSAHSRKKTEMRCPICGTIKTQQISVLVDYGLGCPMCSDGISYAEKLMYNILSQLKCEFKNQVTKFTPGFEWINKNYRYDFYINIDNNKYFIELDGHMHSFNRFQSWETVRKIDIKKDNLANKHGLLVIRINCAYHKINQRFEYIKSNILSSKLSEFIDFALVDWNEANKYANSSNVQMAADAWNNGAYNSFEVAKMLGVSSVTAQSYLKTAGEFGMCDYNIDNVNKRRAIAVSETKRKQSQPIALFKNGRIVGVFCGVTDIEKQSYTLYGEHIGHQNISAVLNGRRKHTKGYTAARISRDEYTQLLLRFSQQNKINDIF